jgi:hypothetical protein
MQASKIVGWIFVTFALLGALLFFAYISEWSGHIPEEVMGSVHGGAASNAPIMLGLFAIAGAYLISLPVKDKD